jgi:hypothetical protein
VAIGYEDVGFGRWIDSLDRYQVKSKGFYAVASKAYRGAGFTSAVHAGVNFSREVDDKDEDINFFFGTDVRFDNNLGLVAEYDMALNDDRKPYAQGAGYGYLNAGARWVMLDRIQMEFNLNIVAALLTIIGYSLNDTIVVYDRIRENLRKYRKMGIVELLDLSVNETLSRTVMTSGFMLIALLVLLILGPDVIFGFTAAMLFGIFIGTYSSIYMAAPILIWLKVGPDSFVPLAGSEAGPTPPEDKNRGAVV